MYFSVELQLMGDVPKMVMERSFCVCGVAGRECICRIDAAVTERLAVQKRQTHFSRMATGEYERPALAHHGALLT